MKDARRAGATTSAARGAFPSRTACSRTGSPKSVTPAEASRSRYRKSLAPRTIRGGASALSVCEAAMTGVVKSRRTPARQLELDLGGALAQLRPGASAGGRGLDADVPRRRRTRGPRRRLVLGGRPLGDAGGGPRGPGGRGLGRTARDPRAPRRRAARA